jgi:hypothetical protein
MDQTIKLLERFCVGGDDSACFVLEETIGRLLKTSVLSIIQLRS